jgi:hypothetical protein
VIPLTAWRQFDAIVRHRPFGRQFLLPAAGVEPLMEVTFAVQERYRDHRQFHVGGRANRVAGEDAESAAVGRHCRIQGDLHREIGDGFSGHQWHNPREGG